MLPIFRIRAASTNDIVTIFLPKLVCSVPTALNLLSLFLRQFLSLKRNNKSVQCSNHNNTPVEEVFLKEKATFCCIHKHKNPIKLKEKLVTPDTIAAHKCKNRIRIHSCARLLREVRIRYVFNVAKALLSLLISRNCNTAFQLGVRANLPLVYM